MMEVTNENVWMMDNRKRESGKLQKFIRKNRVITVLLVSLISFTTVNLVLLYKFISYIEML